jgi:hypothetical protein
MCGGNEFKYTKQEIGMEHLHQAKWRKLFRERVPTLMIVAKRKNRIRIALSLDSVRSDLVMLLPPA